ncbi:DUF1232 domain-containing protein [Tessaracoccus defluvii]|uniref:DUF1232 domain-containing protein n=1 Tax=Tessaracoccus defluvii TaxID=1285901 RepID=A0A7H0H5M5_9ACTN|nr:DUF1232 domain-containing protein [Tessaracoccus defluvii]QNP55841.1 DUF1232 domain-containing protein [Tessaracoccus defluvii]
MEKKKVIGAVATGVIAVLWGASPVDIIPDVLGPIGFADDAAVLIAAAAIIWKLLSGAKKPAVAEVPADQEKPTPPAV